MLPGSTIIAQRWQEQTAKDARDAKGAKDTLGQHRRVRVIPSEALLSSRAAARDLGCVPRGRAGYRVVREDPSLPLGMTSPTER